MIKDCSTSADLISLAWGLTREEGARKLRSLLDDHRCVQGIAKAYPNTAGRLPVYTRAKLLVFLYAYRGWLPRSDDIKVVDTPPVWR